ncbi:MAG: dihydropteroate synthase, partial [Planctomycetota bacterium]
MPDAALDPSAPWRGRRRPLVMGILNVTPDSFSDGGRWCAPADAVAHALAMVADGADCIDIGGESTRPGADPVDPDEQIRRVVPVIEGIRAAATVPISIDTTRAAVAAAALEAGAGIVNDVSAGRDDEALLPLAADRGAGLVLMHMRGSPRTMQRDPAYEDVVAEVTAFLAARRDAATAAGVAADRIVLDPGFGFGKTASHNLTLLRRL